MSTNERQSIERRLKKILESYEQARSIGDFTSVVFSVHTALEDAADVELGDHAAGLTFNQKFQELLPDLFITYKVNDLNSCRNQYAHPKRIFKEEEVRGTARGLVEFALRAWPELFYTGAPAVSYPPAAGARPAPRPIEAARKEPAPVPPFVSTPAPEDPKPAISPPLPGKKKAVRRASRAYLPFVRLPWFSLLLGVVLLEAAIFLAGVIQSSITNRLPGGWYWSALPAALLASAAFFALRGIGRFLRSLGLRRLVAGLAGGVLVAGLAVLAVMPSLVWPAGSYRSALERVWFGARVAGEDAAGFAFEAGQRFSREKLAVFAGGLAGIGPSPASGSEASPGETEDAPSGAKSGEIKVGATVKVRTDGKRLRCREAAGLRSAVVTYFVYGEELKIVDGPVVLDNFTWWKVEGKDGTGWSAQDFLALVPENGE